jgi:membrane associated rhomboid family serine protease
MRPSRQMQPFIRPWPAGGPSATVVLLAASVGMAVAEWVFGVLEGGELFQLSGPLKSTLALSLDGVRQGQFWQFASFMALHSGPFHLVGNLLLLYFAGREVEPIIGRRHFVALYLLGNLAGGLAQVGAMAAGWAHADVPMVGVSAGVAAVIAAYATILPDLEVTVLLFFVLPVRVRAKMLGFAGMAVAAALWISGTASQIGPAGLLAGFVVGWAYVKELGFGNPLAIQRFLYKRRQRAARVARMPAAQFISEEIDPILDKISRDGMHSLTRAERKILERGREKISARRAARD